MKRLTTEPDPWMAWIYAPRYRDDPVARDLRERRLRALNSVPEYMKTPPG